MIIDRIRYPGFRKQPSVFVWIPRQTRIGYSLWILLVCPTITPTPAGPLMSGFTLLELLWYYT